MKQFLNGFIGFLLLALMIVGCKKEEETPTFEQLSFNSEEILAKLPSGLTSSTDQYAQECVSMIEDAIDMSSFIDNMEVPDGAVRSSKKATGDTWTWTWTYGMYTITFHWTYDEDNTKRYWTMEVSFEDGPLLDYITAWEMKDGSQGEVIYNFNWVYVYEDESMEDYEDIYWKYTWMLDDDGTYYFSWYYDTNDVEYDYFMRYDVIIYVDGSGEIDYYFYDEPYYHMEWDILGAGLWWYYFGEMELSGSWPAA